MDHELAAITLAARSVLIRFIEGEYYVFVTQHDGREWAFCGDDLPWIIHHIHDELLD